MDIFDRAQQLDELHRTKAIEAHKRSQQGPVEQLVINGEICCTDCNVAIEPERLKAQPTAAKCVSCKSLEESNSYV